MEDHRGQPSWFWRGVNGWLGLAVCAIVVSYPALGWGQTSPQALFNRGQDAWKWHEYEAAARWHEQAQAAALATGDSSVWAYASLMLAQSDTRQSELLRGEAKLEALLAQAPSLGALHPALLRARAEWAFVRILQGDFSGGLARYQALWADCQGLPPGQDSLRAMAMEDLAFGYIFNSEPDSGLLYAQQALSLFQAIFPPDHLSIAYAHNTLGSALDNLHQLDQAEQHFLQAQAIFQRHFPPDHPNLLSLQTNLGVICEGRGLFWEALAHHQANEPYLDCMAPRSRMVALLNLGSTQMVVGDATAALATFDRAEVLMEAYPGLMAQGRIYLAHERSTIYHDLDQPGKALPYTRSALRLAQDLYGPDSPELISEWRQLGILQTTLRNYDAAKAALFRAKEMAASAPALQRAHLLDDLGALFAEEGNQQASLGYFEAALAAYRQLGSDWNMSRALQGMAQAQSRLGEHRAAMALLEEGWHMLLPALPYERVPGAKFRQHWGLSQLDDWAQMHAQVLARWGQATEDPLVMAEALANYEAFFDVNDSMRCYYQSADSRQELIRYYLPVYEEAIDLAWTLGQRTGEARYAERALGLAERIKARNLADQLRDQQVLSFAGVPDSVYQQEQQLRQRMVALDEAMSVADSSEQTALRLQRHQVASRYQQLRERLAADYPRYFSLRYLPDSSTPTEWLASLAPDEVAYDYFWGDSLLFVFRLWEGEVRMWRHLMGDGDSLITDLNDWLQYLRVPPQEGDDWAQPYRQGQRLGADLLPALPTEASKLRIVPHGPLAYLPFETLLLSDSKPPEGRWAKWPYVLRDHAVSYGYRLSLGMAQSSVAFDASQSYLGLAPVFGADEQATDRGQLGALTHNRAEVTQAAALWQGQALLGAEAYEGQLTQGFPPLKVLHLATHAQVDDADPMQSRLYLAKDPREGADGVLHAYEIYGLRLPAALTVLSACETGRGTWARGEGVMSLARAFRYAGSEQLVYGLWQVDDQAATALTGQLFAGLKAGDRPSAALRSAKLAWLQQASVRQSHPFFWASLVLNGQDQPLPTQPTWPWWTWGGLAILLLPLGWWGWRRLVHDAG